MSYTTIDGDESESFLINLNILTTPSIKCRRDRLTQARNSKIRYERHSYDTENNGRYLTKGPNRTNTQIMHRYYVYNLFGDQFVVPNKAIAIVLHDQTYIQLSDYLISFDTTTVPWKVYEEYSRPSSANPMDIYVCCLPEELPFMRPSMMQWIGTPVYSKDESTQGINPLTTKHSNMPLVYRELIASGMTMEQLNYLIDTPYDTFDYTHIQHKVDENDVSYEIGTASRDKFNGSNKSNTSMKLCLTKPVLRYNPRHVNDTTSQIRTYPSPNIDEYGRYTRWNKIMAVRPFMALRVDRAETPHPLKPSQIPRPARHITPTSKMLDRMEQLDAEKLKRLETTYGVKQANVPATGMDILVPRYTEIVDPNMYIRNPDTNTFIYKRSDEEDIVLASYLDNYLKQWNDYLKKRNTNEQYYDKAWMQNALMKAFRYSYDGGMVKQILITPDDRLYRHPVAISTYMI